MSEYNPLNMSDLKKSCTFETIRHPCMDSRAQSQLLRNEKLIVLSQITACGVTSMIKGSFPQAGKQVMHAPNLVKVKPSMGQMLIGKINTMHNLIVHLFLW